MSALTRRVLAHRRLVALGWLLITLIGMATVSEATSSLSKSFSVPGREGFVTDQRIIGLFGAGGRTDPILAVTTIPAGSPPSSPMMRSALAAVEARLQRVIPRARTASFASTGSPAYLSRDGRTAVVVAYPPLSGEAFGDNLNDAKRATAALAGTRVAGSPVLVTGYDALASQTGGGQGPGVLLEAVLGGLGALLVLGFVFASLLALLPLLIAIVSILTTFLVLWGVTTFASVSFIVQFLVALIGLGVAIDYSLLVVVRWREELAHGADGDEAVVRAMQTAGRAIVFSGTTVAIGLLALIVLPLPYLRSIGFAGMLIPLISVVVSVTLLPVVLSSAGQRLLWPRMRTDDRASRSWTRWAQAVVRHRGVAAGAALAVLAVLVAAATSLQPGRAGADVLAKGGEARAGLVALERSRIGPGILSPIETLVRAPLADRVLAEVGHVAGLHGTAAPPGPAWHRAGFALVDAYPVADASTGAGRDVIDAVRRAAHGAAPSSGVGGQGAQNADFVSAIYDNFPVMIALIAVLTFLLLARAFRSLLLPLKAVILNVISVAAAWGVVTFVWQEGHLSNAIWGIPATHAVTAWIPLMIFAFLFGLSMDYEVFILSRMREEFDSTGSTDEAVVRGIGRTGRLVTSAALILFLAFVSMASGPETDIKVFATGLAAGILLDATVIRALLVPAVVSLLGRWNWWLPGGAARLLRVEPSLAPSAASERI